MNLHSSLLRCSLSVFAMQSAVRRRCCVHSTSYLHSPGDATRLLCDRPMLPDRSFIQFNWSCFSSVIIIFCHYLSVFAVTMFLFVEWWQEFVELEILRIEWKSVTWWSSVKDKSICPRPRLICPTQRERSVNNERISKPSWTWTQELILLCH